MVVKNRGLYLGLLVSLLGVGNVMQAYKLTVENRTRFRIVFSIKYHGESEFIKSCRPDKGAVDPKSISGVIHSGACTVRVVSAWVQPKGMNERAKSYKPPVGKAGNFTFVVHEDHSGGYESYTFKVTGVKYRSRYAG